MKPAERNTHFGFRTVPENEKVELVRDVFVGVANKYDFMNDFMSAGMHRVWKTALVDWLAPQPEQHMLDLAGGTGDIAFRILRRQPEASVTILDLTEQMLKVGQQRAARQRLESSISWVAGSASALPFASGSFDACTVAFGVRNFPDIPKALEEMHRVLKLGGRLLVLEFGHVDNNGLRRLYDRYSFRLIPEMGRLVVNDRDSYQYLVESIRRFPKPDEFAAMIRNAGFERVSFRKMSFGVVSIHSGWKI